MSLTPGFVSSDFGVHPVVSLVRGLITRLNTTRFTVICYAMYDETSWWRHNISGTVSVFRCTPQRQYRVSTVSKARQCCFVFVK